MVEVMIYSGEEGLMRTPLKWEREGERVPWLNLNHFRRPPRERGEDR